MAKISIIVVTFNEARHIARVKAAIDAQTLDIPVEIETILIDGGSRDGTAETARACGFTNVEILPGANIPVCRNAGLQQASGDWMAFLDGDCEPAPDWLSQAFPFLDQSAPVILGWPVEPPQERTWVQQAWYLHWAHKNANAEDWEGHRVVRKEAFRLITTRNMLMNREAATLLDGFDENLPTGEDTDFVFRGYQRGFFVAAVPALRVWHHGEPDTLRAFYKQQLWHANRSSYKKIFAESGGKVGGNAPRFTLLFMGSLLLGMGGSVLALILCSPWWLLAWGPGWALVLLPAARTAFRARAPLQMPAIAVLYATYGWARTLDLIGLFRHKKSWKT